MATSVRLFIVRHGERQDEALIKAYYKKQQAQIEEIEKKHKSSSNDNALKEEGAIQHEVQTPLPPPKIEDRVDPPLTAKGHQQAQHSLSALLGSLGGRKVAMFSSPLRRAIGTALMAGIAESHDGIAWAQLNPENKKEGIEVVTELDDDNGIPILVLNGLGDFASEAYRQGGCDVLSELGSIDCAVMDCNDGSNASPFMQSLTRMSNRCLAKRSPHSKSIRFWKRDKWEKNKFVPVTPTIDPCKDFAQEESEESRNHQHQRCSSYCRNNGKDLIPPPRDPIHAIDKAVKLTISRGCDTCIVVAHREAIRDLAQRCGYQGSMKTPYCCIGSFNAVFHAETPLSIVEYQFSNVWEANKFRLLPSKYMLPRPPPPMGTSTVVFLKPGKVVQALCTVKSDLNVGKLGSQIWLTTKNEGRLGKVNCRSSHIELEILNGRDLWHASLAILMGKKSTSESAKLVNEYVVAAAAKKLGNIKLHGWATWEHPNGHLQVMEVKLSPQKSIESKSHAGLSFLYR